MFSSGREVYAAPNAHSIQRITQICTFSPTPIWVPRGDIHGEISQSKSYTTNRFCFYKNILTKFTACISMRIDVTAAGKQCIFLNCTFHSTSIYSVTAALRYVKNVRMTRSDITCPCLHIRAQSFEEKKKSSVSEKGQSLNRYGPDDSRGVSHMDANINLLNDQVLC